MLAFCQRRRERALWAEAWRGVAWGHGGGDFHKRMQATDRLKIAADRRWCDRWTRIQVRHQECRAELRRALLKKQQAKYLANLGVLTYGRGKS